MKGFITTSTIFGVIGLTASVILGAYKIAESQSEKTVAPVVEKINGIDNRLKNLEEAQKTYIDTVKTLDEFNKNSAGILKVINKLNEKSYAK